MPRPSNSREDARVEVTPAEFDEALRKLIQSPPVDRARFETRRTEVERLYRELVGGSVSAAGGTRDETESSDQD